MNGWKQARERHRPERKGVHERLRGRQGRTIGRHERRLMRIADTHRAGLAHETPTLAQGPDPRTGGDLIERKPAAKRPVS